MFDVSKSNLFLKELIFRWALIILFWLSLRTKFKLLAYYEEDLEFCWKVVSAFLIIIYIFRWIFCQTCRKFTQLTCQMSKLSTCLTKDSPKNVHPLMLRSISLLLRWHTFMNLQLSIRKKLYFLHSSFRFLFNFSIFISAR